MSDSVWQYFNKEDNGAKAKCLKCPNKVLCCKGSSTSGLIRHLEHIHKINLQKHKDKQDSGSSSHVENAPKKCKFQQPVLAFTKCQSMAEIVAKLAAVDGFSIHGICKSEFIRQSLSAQKYSLPKDKHNVMKLIHEFYELAKSMVTEKIKSHTDIGGKFSLTLDEWTSLKNRRYLNVNVHFNKCYINLGLVRIIGSCTAEKSVELVNAKLWDFGISASDVVASTTDGASVMIKFGRLSAYEHQLCYNHGIHLAVLDVIYKKCKNDIESDSIVCDDQNDEDGNDTSDSVEFLEESDDDSNESVPKQHLRTDMNAALNMVRNIVKFFKFSAVRNSILQEYVKQQHGRELNLLLDCKTRWNSMETMLERFLKIVDSIRQALHDLNSTLLDDSNIHILTDIFKALKPIKLAVEALGRRDTNLLTADAIFQFLLDSLRENNDDFSNELLEALLVRIKERRNKDLVTLIKYLQTLDLDNTDDLALSSKAAIVSYATNMMKRIFQEESVDIEVQQEKLRSRDTESGSGTENLNHRLADAINAALKTKMPTTASADQKKTLQKEMQIYEGTGNITTNLQKLLDALMTIQPTSIESERVFSCSSNFCTKKRSSLSDLSLNALTFLKSYFLNIQK